MDERTGDPQETPKRDAKARAAAVGGTHALTISNRQHAAMDGIVRVESFDDRQIVLDTQLGSLVVRGEDLHIRQLDLETGRFQVDGVIHACQYGPPLRGRDGSRSRARGLFERLLR